jgi:hypothetical protein
VRLGGGGFIWRLVRAPGILAFLTPSRYTPVVLTFALAAGVFLASACKHTVPAASDGKARVVFVKGMATYSNSIDRGFLAVGKTVESGQTITTATNAAVVLNLGGNAGILIIKPGSTIELRALEIEPGGKVFTVVINLLAGEVLGTAKQISSKTRYEIRTANAIAGVRGYGCVFGVMHPGFLRCVRGLVVVKPMRPVESFRLRDGESCVISLFGGQNVTKMFSAESRALTSEVHKFTRAH